MLIHQELEAFLRTSLFASNDQGKVTRLVLSHVAAGDKLGDKVLPIDIPKDTTEEYIKETVRTILAAAMADASGIGGNQKYVLHAFVGKSAVGRKTFRCAGEADVNDISTEPPTATGHLSQLMRHCESYAKVISLQQVTMAQTMAQMMEKASEDRREHDRERLEMFHTMQSLLNEQKTRELDEKKAEAKIELMRGAVKELRMIAPAIANRISGREVAVVPQQFSEIIKRLKESLMSKPEKIEALMGILDNGEKLALMQLMQADTGADDSESEN
jgi:hypothetical protein